MAPRVLRAPHVHQDIGGARIKSKRGLLRSEDGDVSDAAEIHDHARVRCRKNTGMENGDQRGALATCRHISASEVGNDADAGEFGEQGRRVELKGIAQVRSMSDGLTMRAERRNLRG